MGGFACLPEQYKQPFRNDPWACVQCQRPCQRHFPRVFFHALDYVSPVIFSIWHSWLDQSQGRHDSPAETELHFSRRELSSLDGDITRPLVLLLTVVFLFLPLYNRLIREAHSSTGQTAVGYRRGNGPLGPLVPPPFSSSDRRLVRG